MEEYEYVKYNYWKDFAFTCSIGLNIGFLIALSML